MRPLITKCFSLRECLHHGFFIKQDVGQMSLTSILLATTRQHTQHTQHAPTHADTDIILLISLPATQQHHTFKQTWQPRHCPSTHHLFHTLNVTRVRE